MYKTRTEKNKDLHNAEIEPIPKKYDVAIFLQCEDCDQEEIVDNIKRVTLETKDDSEYEWEQFDVLYDYQAIPIKFLQQFKIDIIKATKGYEWTDLQEELGALRKANEMITTIDLIIDCWRKKK